MKSSSRGRRYDAAFKEQAVELLLNSAKNPNQVALELGLSHVTLARWKQQYLDRRRLSATELENEVRRLRSENEQLRKQRDILKKSLGILSEEPLQKGLPR